MVLYIVRAVAYEIPYYGGRSQGRGKPKAPTLKKRPNGRKRTFSMTGSTVNGSTNDEKENFKRRSLDLSEGDEPDDLTEEGRSGDYPCEFVVPLADLNREPGHQVDGPVGCEYGQPFHQWVQEREKAKMIMSSRFRIARFSVRLLFFSFGFAGQIEVQSL